MPGGKTEAEKGNLEWQRGVMVVFEAVCGEVHIWAKALSGEQHGYLAEGHCRRRE